MSLGREDQKNHVCIDKNGDGDFYRVEKREEGKTVSTEIRCRCGKLLESDAETK